MACVNAYFADKNIFRLVFVHFKFSFQNKCLCLNSVLLFIVLLIFFILNPPQCIYFECISPLARSWIVNCNWWIFERGVSSTGTWRHILGKRSIFLLWEKYMTSGACGKRGMRKFPHYLDKREGQEEICSPSASANN